MKKVIRCVYYFLICRRLQAEPRRLLHDTFQKISERVNIAIGKSHLVMPTINFSILDACAEIIGQTSEMCHSDIHDARGEIDHEATAIMSRSMEIKAYVEKHDFKGKGVRWIIIDDMDLGQDPDLRWRLVRTNPTEGLTAQHAVEAISRLNS